MIHYSQSRSFMLISGPNPKYNIISVTTQIAIQLTKIVFSRFEDDPPCSFIIPVTCEKNPHPSQDGNPILLLTMIGVGILYIYVHM